MKSRAKRLKLVCDFVADKEQEAARQLGECKRSLDEQNRRLRDLENYHQEYAGRITQAGSISIQEYRNLQAFMLNLNKAIEQQKQIVQRLEAEYQCKKQHWLDIRNRGKALNKVTEKYQAEEDYQRERRLQRELDDRIKLPQGGKD